MAKDNWDKLDIIFKIVILGLIPIVINSAASNVADSFKRGELIQSLVSTLSEKDSKRDISLIALNDAIRVRQKCIMFIFACRPDTDNDPVSQIAILLMKSSIEEAIGKKQLPRELPVVNHLFTKSQRADPGFYKKELMALGESSQSRAISNVNPAMTGPKKLREVAEAANISQALAILGPAGSKSQDKGLEGVRLVFIQYDSNKPLAKKIQDALNKSNVSAPGTERVAGIAESSIRYSGPSDLEAAKGLDKFLKDSADIKIESLVDLSRSGYRVPRGQIEVWIQ